MLSEVEKDYFDQEVVPLLDSFEKRLPLLLEENREQLKRQLILSFEGIGEQVREKYSEFKVNYLMLSLTRASILDGNYEVVVNVYDEQWYQGLHLWESFSIGYLFEELKQSFEKIKEQIKRYLGKVRISVIEYYILQQLDKWNRCFSYYLIDWLKQWDEEVSFQILPKGERLEVSWGSYKSFFHTVYLYENCPRTDQEFQEAIAQNRNLIFSTWASLHLKQMEIQHRDLTCIHLKHSCLENITFEDCRLIGANLKKIELKNCTFRKCDLIKSDLSEAHLDHVVFKDCNLEEITTERWKTRDVYIVSHKGIKEVVG